MVKNYVLVAMLLTMFAIGNFVSLLIPTHTKPYFKNPPPPPTKFAFLDVSSVLLGFRKFGADIAWIQLLQYLGTQDNSNLTREESFYIALRSAKKLLGIDLVKEMDVKETKPDFENGKIKYMDLAKYTKRVIRLDPKFKYAYLFSAGALAWNYERTSEALEILREGIINNPDEWQFYTYISAILYKEKRYHEEMLLILEKAIRQKDSPNIIKVIVANYYEKEKRYADAIKIWMNIIESKDPMYYERGLGKVEKLSATLGF